MRTILLLMLIPFSTACLGPMPADPAAEWAEQRQREWNELNRLKGELRWRYDEPVRFETEAGRITVRDWWLEGGPGWEYVRARFTYENTTQVSMETVTVQLSVLTADGDTVVASKLELRHPWGLPLHPGTMFSDQLTVPTDGAHLRPEGWHWTVQLRGRVETDPGMLALR